MNLDSARGLLLCLVVVLASFFWARGIIRGRKDDLIAGFSILVVLCNLLLAASASFGEIGGMVGVFGLVTLAASSFAKPDCPLKRSERAALGVGFMIVGLVLSIML